MKLNRDRHTWVLLARVAGAALVGLAGLFVFAAAPASAASAHVNISSYAYSPASVSVTAGDVVTWTNLDSVGHDVTVTSGPVAVHSPLLQQGQSWSFTFTTAGSYSYICSVHPDMKGSVTVAPAAAAAPVAPAPAAITPTRAAAKQAPAPAASAPVTTPPSAPSPAAATDAQTTGSTAPAKAADPTETFNPLLLVGGAIVAVLVFCLLLIASRPAGPAPAPAAAPAAEQAPDPKPDDELMYFDDSLERLEAH